MYLRQMTYKYIIREETVVSMIPEYRFPLKQNRGFLYSGTSVSVLWNCGVKPPGILISADLLLGTAISTYNLTMLKDIEQRIQLLPAFKQQRLLDIFDAIISVELNHDQCERPYK